MICVLFVGGCDFDTTVPTGRSEPLHTVQSNPSTHQQTSTPIPNSTNNTIKTPTGQASLETPSPEVLQMAAIPSDVYGVVYPYPSGSWTDAERQSIRTRLHYLKSVGVNTVIQIFSSRLMGTSEESAWLIFLDEAEKQDIQVVARLWPSVEWDGEKFDFKKIGQFISVVRDHPALLAYLGLHEPYEIFTSDQLREFYIGVKTIAPEIQIAHFMGNIVYFDRSLRYRNAKFSADICDICIVWYYPFRDEKGQAVYEEEQLRDYIIDHKRIISDRDPMAQMWFLGQSYAQAENKKASKFVPEKSTTSEFLHGCVDL